MSEATTPQETRHPVRGWPLLLIRIVWSALAVLVITVFIASALAHFHYEMQQSVTREAVIGQGTSPPAHFRVGYAIAFDGLTALVFIFTATAIFWRGSNDRMAILVSTALLSLGVAISPTLDTLQLIQPAWQIPVLIVQFVGFGLILFVFYLFPDGRFVPHWTRILALVWVGWGIAWFAFPTASFDPENMPTWLRVLAFVIAPETDIFSKAQYYLRLSSFMVMLFCWLGSGVFAQIYRFIHISGPLQKQQTKWVVFGLTAAVIGYFGFQIPLSLIPIIRHPGQINILYQMIGKPISTALLLLAPLSILLSLMRYRLWDIDPIIQRTLVYGGLTTGLGVFYVASVFILQRIFQAITDQESDLAIILSTLAISALFQPLRRRIQSFIDRAFYREKVDFRRAFTNFAREIRTIIELPELLRVLINRTTELLHIAYGAVYLRNADGAFERAEARELPQGDFDHLPLETGALGRLEAGYAISPRGHETFPLLVPLAALRREGSEMVGVLALGPRLSGQGYSREDRTLLTSLADQAGTAIYVARLIQERQDEIRRREEIERRLQAHRNSPIGRAEAFAESLLFEPSNALIALHDLAQKAAQDPNAASLIDNLPRVLDSLGTEPLANLAQGFSYLVDSEYEPEMLPVGLRTLIAQLENYPIEGMQYLCRWDPDQPHTADKDTPIKGLQHAAEAVMVYSLCQQALNASTIPQIAHLLDPLKGQGKHERFALFRGLDRIMDEMFTVAEALHAYERVDTSQDKLAYLASAVERLRRIDYLSHTELSSADRPMIHAIAEDWLAIVTGTMGDLQTRAQIACQLLTRHTWQKDVVPLVLSLRNDGRGAALNLQITLAPGEAYTSLDEVAKIERLGPGEEARVELRVRPRLEQGIDQFRTRFVILYTDPRGPDQVENFADVVRLLVPEGEFQFIPNPYVVGTPLEADSPLFFGREDVVAFIQENLSAQHRNNLVLIGQRRTGKTSLLKQLPVRLGDDYLPVYLDGQALGLDPGLPNFFLALATEIAFALEDRGFGLDPPEYEDFAESPAVSFERDFLTRVRQAIEHRHLLIMFDEFEELESAVGRGSLDPSIFGFLRHLIQHLEKLSVIFCGTHRLEELAADYWSVLFNISLYRHIAFLDKAEAMHLIQEPVAAYGMRYDDLALDKIWQVTAGHPYFLQLLCHSLVNQHNKTERNYVTVADVNAALDEILASGEAHFVYLWASAAPAERLVMAALSRMLPLTGRATPVQVGDYLAERGAGMERQALGDALHQLALRDILVADSEADPTVGQVYRWRLGLLGLWVEKYKSMSRVMEEMRV
ncbi:MAG: AAA family ATPase [Anaerolineae bacterium]|nr:AAA family ATPase [Anaerolineae bacterium]